MANLTLAHRDSYLEFMHGGVKPNTLAALCTAPVHLHSLFPDSLLVKAEDEISCSEERRSSGSLAVHTGSLDVFTHMLPQVTNQRISRTGSLLHWPGSKLETSKWDRKVVAMPQTSPKNLPRVQRKVNHNYCVLNAAGVKDSVHVSDKKEDLNPSPVTRKSETVFLHVNSFVANVHSVTGCHKRQA